MSVIEEVITALQSVIDELGDATNSAETARSEADEGMNLAVASGGAASIADTK